MSYLRPLRDELLRHRKRKQISLDGSVPGVESGRPQGDYVTADLGPWGLLPRAYVGPSPQDYEPHPGFAQVPDAEYETYDPGLPHHRTPMLRDPGPEPVRSESVPNYDDCRMTDPLLERALADEGIHLLPAEPAGTDSLENLAASPAMIDDSESLEMRVVNMIEPDVIHEIESACQQQMQLTDAFESPQPEPSPYVLQDGYLQAYEEQRHQTMDAYWRPGPPIQGPFEPQQPEPMPLDPFEEHQQMYDEQTQQSMDPFNTMGLGPMM